MDERTDKVTQLLADSRRKFDYPESPNARKESYYDLVQAVFELNKKVNELKKVVDSLDYPGVT